MNKKVMTVVGARPQFIKAAVVSHALRGHCDVNEEIIHTGQHFDENMSQTFFDELNIPKPKSNLGISGGTHGRMTGRMLELLENEMIERAPGVVLLYGDTNSTLAAALAAAKLHIPLVHVEAGARTYSSTNPEEINRVCTDHIATLLLACTKGNLENLKQENLADRSELIGDPMYDAFLQYSLIAKKPDLTSIIDSEHVELPENYYYVTCHREENTGTDEALDGLLDALRNLDLPSVYPVHPRNFDVVKQKAMQDESLSRILFVNPVGYLESIYMVNHSKQVITDSGGLQREAFFAGVKCTTLLDFEVWPETMVDGRNVLARPSRDSILAAMAIPQLVDESYQPFGDGRAAKRIADHVVELLERC